MHRVQQVTKQLLSGAAKGRVSRALQRAGAAGRRFPNAAPSARRAVRSSAPGAGPPPRADAPSRAPSPGPRVKLPSSPAPAQLCSALTLEAEVQGACAPRRRPLLSAAWAAAAPALPVIGEHALVDHHDEEGAHAVKAGSQQLQEHGQRFGRRHPQLLLMSVCGGFRGGFSFNPSMLTSMNFRHGCCGGGGLGWDQPQGLAAAPDATGACAGRSRSTRGAGTGGLGRLRLPLLDCLHRHCPSPPMGRNAGVHTPGDFARALCAERGQRVGATPGRAWAGAGEGLEEEHRRP